MAASECKIWRDFKVGTRYQESWIGCKWTANNLTYPLSSVDINMEGIPLSPSGAMGGKQGIPLS